MEDLLPIEYFHVVFTLPAQIAVIGYQVSQRFTGFCSKRQPERC
ncbi:MAG: hypothetical protein R8G34_20560 [Paracoccaceae bacterium]|nr:hypothetical protein [Paracoccaceae bacterium]